MTIIYICYLVLPGLERLYRKTEKKQALTIALLWIICVAIGLVHVYLFDLMVFYIGFVMGKRKTALETKLQATMLIISTILVQGLRLILRSYIDGTFWYDKVLSSFSHAVLALCMVMILRFIWNYIFEGRLSERTEHQIIWLDRLTMYIYIVHNSFLNGVLATEQISDNIFIWILLFIIMTLLAGITLKTLSEALLSEGTRVE